MQVIFGISGSVAAFKGLEVIRLLVADGVNVHPVLSRGGSEFITRISLEALSGNPATSEIFSDAHHDDIEHIAVVKHSDLMVTCPASADIIAKYAHGIADDPLALTALTFGTPHLIVPAMNHRMWNNPATSANVETLTGRGYEFVGPVEGMMACNEYGTGHLADVATIHGEIMTRLGRNGPLNGVKVLVTAGSTREKIDDARFISNRSSGKMGFALAEAARNLGAKTTLVTGIHDVPVSASAGVNVKKVDSASEMYDTVLNAGKESDVILMAAAVPDFTVANPKKGKLKKSDGLPILKLAPTEDILLALGKKKNKRQVLIGFAAEYGNKGKKEVVRKCIEKNCDFMCHNDISRKDAGFETDDNEMTIIWPDGKEKLLKLAPKKEVAGSILCEVINLRDGSKDSK
ncbi:MAG TPA: bifunctional phosphopantothenoylcysteine decarboxylase/phosphopantothenate--cysteine ligase CoaBC [bacterium]|jgi:phosphopantothenoylcysteine decarboxylase/phosphopantothenate--cysteine ligase